MNSKKVDVCIVGGGINGAALARLAACNGLSCLLLEKNDFGSGASTATSKLIHGGLRYLEQGNFKLVREAVKERKLLSQTCPHLVYPYPFIFPQGPHSRYPGFLSGLGIGLYELLSEGFELNRHYKMSPLDFRKNEPFYLPGTRYSAHVYYDCQMDDARLVMENLIDARQMGAELLNYQEIKAIRQVSDSVEVDFEDRINGRQNTVSCGKLLLTVGPWSDEVVASLLPEFKNQKRVLGSQGSHLFVKKLPIQHSFILPVPKSKRYFFVLPWKSGHLIGTTETDPGQPPEAHSLSKPEEIEELKGLFKFYFPDLELKIQCHFAGIRPLAPHKGSSVTASRTHQFYTLSSKIFLGSGGKYTTHRIFAQEMLELALGRKVESIAERMFPGALDFHGPSAMKHKLLKYPLNHPTLLNRWCQTYGSLSDKAGEYTVKYSDYRDNTGINELPTGEVHYLIDHEWARQPEDILRRRTDWFFHPDGGIQHYDRLMDVFEAKQPDFKELHPYPDYLREHQWNL